MIDTLMIFAAGRGTRMRQLTVDKPKSLIEIQKKSILHHTLELSLTYPFKRIVINSHYLHEQIRASINDFKEEHNRIKIPEIIEIFEPELLETGGAIKNAADILGENPIFTLNSDVIIKAEENVFQHLISKWEPLKMDFLLLLQSYEKAIGYKGKGDFNVDDSGKVTRSINTEHYNYMYAGLAILKPKLIKQNPKTIFSLQDYYLNGKQVYGHPIEHCKWYHVSSPENIIEIESDFNNL